MVGTRCKYVEGGLAISHRSFDICCRARELPELVVAPFESGEDTVPLDALLERRREMRERFEAETMPAHCRRCPHFEEGEWNEPTHTITQLNFKHHTMCQLFCIYCHRAKRDARPGTTRGVAPLSTLAAVRDLIDQGHLAPGAGVGWGGGEHTLLKNFEEIFSLLLRHGCRQGVPTNAIVYSEVLAEALEAGRLTLTCSIDAGTAETYRLVKGGDYIDEVLENLRRYYSRAARKRSIRIKYVIRRENMNAAEIASFLELCSAFPRVQVVFDIDVNIPTEFVGRAVEGAVAAMHSHQDLDLVLRVGPNLRAAAAHAGLAHRIRLRSGYRSEGAPHRLRRMTGFR